MFGIGDDFERVDQVAVESIALVNQCGAFGVFVCVKDDQKGFRVLFFYLCMR